MNNYNTALDNSWLLESFDPISLDELNSKAEMLSRIDNKYVVRRDTLQKVIAEVADDFEILDIENCRAFTYDTRYFDDPERSAYYEHHQGLRKGFKVRIRRYTDSDLCFLEVKVKGKRGMTVKHRLPHDPQQLDGLSDEAFGFAQNTYSNHYGKPFEYNLQHALDLRYQRITLVAKEGGERMTIDTDLTFRSGGKSVCVSPDVFIVETKSQLGRGIADLSFRKVHERPQPKCSKYCVGMAALGEVNRWNQFLPTMRKLELTNAVVTDETMPLLNAA
ncbi:MAG: polyphosphate polymerase domain-containing protein [Halopseudomonas sp.]